MARLYGFRRLDDWRRESLKIITLVASIAAAVFAVYALWILLTGFVPRAEPTPDGSVYRPSVPVKSSDYKSNGGR
jgi:hypothetical protein